MFNIFNRQTMLGDVLHITIWILIFIPDDTNVPHGRLHLSLCHYSSAIAQNS
jgi:hypothetical protein